ncbi:hypothetical protein [Streptomyces sp. 35G-GA-8]|uniref:hypothetical protein n=1 Tax=Streptomyces sp. 35G-GA-8 TaxID=2939434 RepID=UPI00201F74FB|nr:hypothetical protein [Streptomyces sp. 35G-GA-8]
MSGMIAGGAVTRHGIGDLVHEFGKPFERAPTPERDRLKQLRVRLVDVGPGVLGNPEVLLVALDGAFQLVVPHTVLAIEAPPIQILRGKPASRR